MLSRVAERVYWTARYLERVESTARLITIYDKLLFDLPRNVKLSWYNLIIINGLEIDFNERYSVRDERNVIKFMLGDESNPSSVLTSLSAIRENIRTSRDVVLAETWEQVNELTMYVQENIQQGINRKRRHEFLEDIIKGCQQILGLWYSNMPRDAAWSFLRLGSNLERADMTSRNLDAGAAAVLELEDDDNAVNSQQIIWGNVLRSLNADQSYRRATRSAVKGPAVVEFLLQDDDFPRSIGHCMNVLIEHSSELPNSEVVAQELTTINQDLFRDVDYQTLGEPFRDYLNELQIQLQQIHKVIREAWFPAQV